MITFDSSIARYDLTLPYHLSGILEVFDGEGWAFRGFDALAFDPEGKYVAVADRNGRVNIYVRTVNNALAVDKLEMYKSMRLKRGTGGLRIAWHPDKLLFDPLRKWLVFLATGNAYLIRLADDKLIELPVSYLQRDGFVGAAFSADGRVLALTDGAGMSLWDVETQKQIASSITGDFTAIQFAADRNQWVTGDRSGKIAIWGVTP